MSRSLNTAWCNGDIYGYEVARITACPCCGEEKEEPVDSCWGFYGLDNCGAEAAAIIAAQRQRASEPAELEKPDDSD